MSEHSRLIRLIEVPSDLAGAKRGASLGINAIRSSSLTMCSSLEKCSSYFDKYPLEVIKDENRAFFDGTEFKNAKYIDKVSLVIKRVAKTVKDLREKSFFPIIMAGDHSSAAGTIAGLKLAHPNDEIGVVYIDAHADIHSPYTSPSGNIHGMPLAIATAIDNIEHSINKPTQSEILYWEELKNLTPKPAIKPENIVFCGLRDFQEAEDFLIKKHHIQSYSTNDITTLGVQKTAEKIFQSLSHCKHIYISFDVDSIDPKYIPGTGTKADKGISFNQALELNVELIKNKKVCCWEIAEINPILDKHNISGKYSFLILEKITEMLIENY